MLLFIIYVLGVIACVYAVIVFITVLCDYDKWAVGYYFMFLFALFSWITAFILSVFMILDTETFTFWPWVGRDSKEKGLNWFERLCAKITPK